MIIKCEKCQSKYNIPEEKLPEGRATATCKKCGNKIIIKKDTHETSLQCPICGQFSNTYECRKCDIDIDKLIQLKEKAFDNALSLLRKENFAESKKKFRYIVDKFPASYGNARKYIIALDKIEPALRSYNKENQEKVILLLSGVDKTLPEVKDITDRLLQKSSTFTNTLKKCPFCAEMIAQDAVKCKHCGEFFNKKYHSQQEKSINGIEKYKIAGFSGVLLNFIGVFLPIIHVPIAGNVNYFQNGKGDGVIIWVLAGLTAYYLLTDRTKKLYFTGIGSLAMLIFTFVYFQLKMQEVTSQMNRELAGNPFRGFADIAVQSVQFQWGWAVLIVGSCLMIVSAKMYEKS